jgi:ligand-binding sensor domain-containing protein
MQYALRFGVIQTLVLVSLACAACSFDPPSATDTGPTSEPDSSGSGGSKGKPVSGAGGRSAAHAGADSAGESGAGADSPTRLWYGGSSLCEFTPEQLQASADHNPAVMFSIASLTAVLDVAFDASGNAWLVGTGSDSIFRLSAASLEKPESAKPDLVLSSSALESPANLTFDANGSLWVATRPPIKNGRVEEGSIMRFDLPDGKSGALSLTPAAQLSSTTAGDLDLIGNITFDDAQNLWVSSLTGLVRFDRPLKEKGTVALDPGAVIDKTGYTNNIHFYSVTFDSSGALWAASGDGLHYLTSVTEFADPASLEGRSSPEARATIMGPTDLLPAGGLAFDGTGSLWLTRGNGVVMYSDPGSLSGTVDPPPDIDITVKGNALPSTSGHLLFAPAGQ